MSARVTSSGVGIAQTAEHHPRARAGGDRAVVDPPRRRDVLDRQAKRLEERDLLRRAAPDDARRVEEQLADLADDVVVADESFALRHEKVAALVERRFAAVDVESRPGDRRAIELTR